MGRLSPTPGCTCHPSPYPTTQHNTLATGNSTQTACCTQYTTHRTSYTNTAHRTVHTHTRHSKLHTFHGKPTAHYMKHHNLCLIFSASLKMFFSFHCVIVYSPPLHNTVHHIESCCFPEYPILCKLEWSAIAHCLIRPTPLSPMDTLLVFLHCIASPSLLNIPLGSLQPPTRPLSISDSPHCSLNTHWRTDGHLPHTKTTSMHLITLTTGSSFQRIFCLQIRCSNEYIGHPVFILLQLSKYQNIFFFIFQIIDKCLCIFELPSPPPQAEPIKISISCQ